MTGQVSAAPSSRSKACQECRIAKLKCGNERPSCYRCVNKGYQCEYPDPLEINFRNENYKAAVRAESLWRQRSSVYATDSSQTYPARSKIFQSVQSRSSSSNGCPITQSSRSYIQVKNDIRHTAITKFFQDFGCTSQIKTPWLDFFQMLPEFYEKPSSTDSPIAHIILAVAIAYLPHDGSYPESEILARTEYCEGIHKISAHLRRRTQVPMNEIIVSTILMGLFESLMPQLSVEDFCQGLRWLTHLHGAFAMVRMIEMHGAADLDLRIPNVIYFQTVITCIRNRIRPPLSIQTWYCMGNSAVPRSPGPPILHLMYRVACWQADMDAAMSKGNVDPRQAEADIVEMLVTLRAADIRILQFKSTLPPNMVFHIRNWNDQGDEYPLSRNHPLLNLPGAPRNVYTFRSCWSTTPRVLALVLRVVIHRNIVKCCTWMAQRQPQAEDWLLQSTVSRNIIIDMVEHISCCVNSLLMDPFIPPWELDEKPSQEYQYERGIGTSMRLMGLPWPMLVATMALDDGHVLRGVGRHRAQWLRAVQDYVHDQVGIRHSLLQESSPQAHLNTQARALDMDILGGPDALSLADPVPPLPGYVLSGNV